TPIASMPDMDALRRRIEAEAEAEAVAVAGEASADVAVAVSVDGHTVRLGRLDCGLSDKNCSSDRDATDTSTPVSETDQSW
ncbi:hypothetical protein HDU93_006312, partial [Gonapodya sp. JEL0774]